MARRVVITGAGIISAIGVGKEATVRSILERRSGIGRLRHLVTAHSDLPCGEAALSDAGLKALLGIPPEEVVARTALLGIVAVKEAIAQAGLPEDEATALVGGTTVGGMDITENHFGGMISGDAFNALIPLHTCGSSTDRIAGCFKGFTSVTTTSTACSSAANSIALGANLVRSGRFDSVVAGGSECLTRYHLNGFNSLMILDHEPCRPFDAGRAGLNLGEGAGFLVLEEEGHALNRGARIMGVLDGWGNACDAYHQTASSPDGEGAFLAMGKALAMAGLGPGDVDYVNAHGTGTVNNDSSESAALRRLFGEAIPPVSSTKSFTGHTTSASGGIEAVICLLAMEKGFIPANLGWEKPDGDCIVPEQEGKEGVSLSHVLCNSFAFGGNDSSLLLSKYEGHE